MYTSVDQKTLPLLSPIYVKLYEAIRGQRPSLQARLEEAVSLALDWDVEGFAGLVQRALEEIEGTFQSVEADLRDAEAASSPARAALLHFNAFLRIYTHANYWYVLLDGVIFEGVFEDAAGKLLEEIAETARMPLLGLLTDVVEPLTPYHYVEIAEERVAAAELQRTRLLAALGGRSDLKQAFDRFLLFHSAVKKWQMDFKEVHRRYFPRYIPKVRSLALESARALGVGIRDEDLLMSQDDSRPWRLLEIVTEQLVPAACKALPKLAESDSSLGEIEE